MNFGPMAAARPLGNSRFVAGLALPLVSWQALPMTKPTFQHLNHGWNAEPNDPSPSVTLQDGDLDLRFLLNTFAYLAQEGQCGLLTFHDVAQWRLGPTNDEGWYRGQCRYSRVAPDWGEFHELTGPDDCGPLPDDWHLLVPPNPSHRHFLFYLRDNTFECMAQAWRFTRGFSRG